MNFPSDLLYSKDHEWVRIEGDIGTVGITDFAQKELGDIVYIDVNTKGKTLAYGAVFGTIEAVKTVSDLFMPIAGEVIEINSALNDKPETVNQDPYNAGWIVKVKLSPNPDTSALMNADAYRQTLG